MRGTQVRGPEIPCRLNSCVRDRCETRRKEEGGRRGGGGEPSARIGYSRRPTVVLEGKNTVCKHSTFPLREYGVGRQGFWTKYDRVSGECEKN